MKSDQAERPTIKAPQALSAGFVVSSPENNERDAAGADSVGGGRLIFVHSLIDDLGLTPGEFRVYAHLAGRRAGADGIAWPAAKSIAETCRIHRDTVFRVLKSLEVRGLIVREKIEGRSSRYRFPRPSAVVVNGGASLQTGSPETNGQHSTEAKGQGVPVSEGWEATGLKGHEGDPLNGYPQKKPEGAAAPDRALAGGALVLEFPCTGREPTWQLRQDFVDELAKLYPALDVMAECRLAHAKIGNGAVSKKTARGMAKFLFSWMDRASNSRRGSGRDSGQRSMFSGAF